MSTAEANKPRTPSPILAGLLSLILPGAGQAYCGDRKRGAALFIVVATAVGATIWYGVAGWYFIPVLLWGWVVYDAVKIARGGSAPIFLAALLWLTMAYGIGWQATQIDFNALAQNGERAQNIISQILNPDFFEENSESHSAMVRLELPCGQGESKPAEKTTGVITVGIDKDCVFVNDEMRVTAAGLWPNEEVIINWRIPLGNSAKAWRITADGDGKIDYTISVPPQALAQSPDITLPQPHDVEVLQRRSLGGIRVSQNGEYILQGLFETLAMALLATTIGAILALPFAFLAAQNLMRANPLTMLIYYIVRTLMNLLRSIESLIMAIVFVTIVGLGAFAGMIAITIHTVAALAKLYSEVIEGIDTGPIEAIRATGANWFQVVRYAVIPQIVPAFTALTIYRWDINVRSSIIVGMVGGGGIGFFLIQWMQLSFFRAVGSCFLAIILVVITLDFFSAKLRERLM